MEYKKPVITKTNVKYSINEVTDRYHKCISELRSKIKNLNIHLNKKVPSFSRISKDCDYSIYFDYLDSHGNTSKHGSTGSFPIYYDPLKSNFELLQYALVDFNLEKAFSKAVFGADSDWMRSEDIEDVFKKAEKYILSCDSNS